VKVLVVDDDKGVVEMLRAVLSTIPGVQVAVAYGARDAYEIARKSWVDVVVCDHNMPGPKGDAVYHVLRGPRVNWKGRFILHSSKPRLEAYTGHEDDPHFYVVNKCSGEVADLVEGFFSRRRG